MQISENSRTSQSSTLREFLPDYVADAASNAAKVGQEAAADAAKVTKEYVAAGAQKTQEAYSEYVRY